MQILIYLLGTALIGVEAYKGDMPLIKNVWQGGTHSEGPHWSAAENALYWVDISAQKVHRLDPTTGDVATREITYGPVSPVVTVAETPGVLLICVRTELYFMHWDSTDGDSSLRLLSVLDLGLPNNRCNDGKVDAKGRLWIGTMGKEVKGEVDLDQGSLYVVTEKNYLNPLVKVRPVSVSNGIAWTRNSKFMFYIDTPSRNIDVFDFNLDIGGIRNRRTLFNFASNNVTGLPDGMTIDTEGNLWVACFNGGKVIKIDSRSGKLLEQHKLPVEKVTSVAWGGPEMSTLYVTTSKVDLTTAELAKQPEAGSVFAIEGTGAKGLPPNEFRYSNAETY
ncbi:Regucalcin [Eumeta japonica]|uniref:Regucalcin n=1 Tax=Eumeta variegata TaxID=151549 RepID=A0A4C1XEC2_EUMVA|nr:Regucalcin [Eumeta japonica]